MFTRQNIFSDRLKYDKKSFNEVVRLLRLAGFEKIQIKIPKDYQNFKRKSFTPEEFIKQEYNFVASILVACKEQEKETIKVLFVNNSKAKTSFEDTTFPSSLDMGCRYYIDTSDPVRLIGIDDFVKRTLSANSSRDSRIAKLQSVFYILNVFYIWFWFFFAVTTNLPENNGTISAAIRIFAYSPIGSILLFEALIYLFFYTVNPGGLYVNPFEHPWLSFIKRVLTGDYKNNLIINFFLSLTKIVFIAIFSNIIWVFAGSWILDLLHLKLS